MSKDRLAVEFFNRLKERAEQNKRQAETDLKILEEWKRKWRE